MIVSLAPLGRLWALLSPCGAYPLSDPLPTRDAALELAALRMWTVVPLEA